MIGFSQYFVQIFSDVRGDDLDPNWCFFYGRNHDGAGIIQPAGMVMNLSRKTEKGGLFSAIISSMRLACAG